MQSKNWIVRGNETRIDPVCDVEPYMLNQSIMQAHGHLPGGSIPVIDETHVRQAKACVDRTHL